MKKPKYPRIPEHLRLNRKLTDRDIKLIPLLRQRFTVKEVSDMMGCCESTIKRWCATPEQRKRWARSTHTNRNKQELYDMTNRCHKRRQQIMPKEQSKWYREYARYQRATGLK